MKPNNSEKHQKDLFTIMTVSTALAFGVMVGFFCSITEITHHFKVTFSVWTIVGFAAGATLGWLFWRIVKHLEEKAKNSEHNDE